MRYFKYKKINHLFYKTDGIHWWFNYTRDMVMTGWQPCAGSLKALYSDKITGDIIELNEKEVFLEIL